MKGIDLDDYLPPKKDTKWNESDYVFFYDCTLGLTSLFVGWYDYNSEAVFGAHHMMPMGVRATHWFEIPKQIKSKFK